MPLTMDRTAYGNPRGTFSSEETQNLRALTTAGVLETLPDERFDRITRLACHALRVPTAVVVLHDRECRWMKSAQGLDGTAAETWLSLCDRGVVEGQGPSVIADALTDGRIALHPLVQGAPYVRFFAGHGLVGPDGSRIGSLCAIDRVARTLSRDDADVLVDLAAMVEREISLLETATTDDLTRLSNRRGFCQVAAHVLARCDRDRQPATVVCLDLDHFKSINDQSGHAAGDQVLREFAKLLGGQFRDCEAIGRLGGDEFAVILRARRSSDVLGDLERLREGFARTPLALCHRQLSWSVGLADYVPGSGVGVDELLHRADVAMYEAKARGRAADAARDPPRSSRLRAVLAHARALTGRREP